MTENMPTPDSRATAEEYVAAVIAGPSHETDPADFDVAGITDALYIVNRSWNMSAIEHDVFWEAVQMHVRA